jgi:hypothetical protein
MQKTSRNNYWEECIAIAAEECNLSLTPEQLDYLAESVLVSHENYGLAFYSPPSSERIQCIEAEWKKKYDALQKEQEIYRKNAETAIKQALNIRRDSNVEIKECGEVLLHEGRTIVVQ